MSLSARRVLRSSCHIAVPPSCRSTVITEPAHSNQLVEPTDSVDERTLPVGHALINGAEHSPHQYVSAFFIYQNLYCLAVMLFDFAC